MLFEPDRSASCSRSFSPGLDGELVLIDIAERQRAGGNETVAQCAAVVARGDNETLRGGRHIEVVAAGRAGIRDLDEQVFGSVREVGDFGDGIVRDGIDERPVGPIHAQDATDRVAARQIGESQAHVFASDNRQGVVVDVACGQRPRRDVAIAHRSAVVAGGHCGWLAGNGRIEVVAGAGRTDQCHLDLHGLAGFGDVLNFGRCVDDAGVDQVAIAGERTQRRRYRVGARQIGQTQPQHIAGRQARCVMVKVTGADRTAADPAARQRTAIVARRYADRL